MQRTIILVLTLALFTAACGSNGASISGPGTAQAPAGLSAAGKTPAVLEPGVRARLQALMDHPGTAGVDYNPQRITVYYLPGAAVPATLSGAPANPAARAAAQRNAPLRVDKQYEALTDAIAARYGLGITNQVYLEGFNIAGFSLPDGADGAQVLARLRQDFAASLAYAGFSQYYQHAASLNDPDFNNSTLTNGPQWGHKRIRCDAAFDFTTGNPGVRIAVVDTGVRITHQELVAQVLDPQVEFPAFKLDIPNNDNTMEDSDGHGTFIAGLIAAQVNNSRTMAGAAYDCEVIPVKITNGGSASDADIYEGCLLADQLGARAINLSFGDEHDDPYLEQMVNLITGHGHLFVGAAGNNGSQTPEYPGGYTNSLCVGATKTNDHRSDFSNYGNWVDIAAPGEYLKSCTPEGDNRYNNYLDGSGSGTSFAAPLVAAAAGLLWSFKSNLTVAEVKTLLTTTGATTSGFNNANVLRLDIAAALAALNTLKLTAPEPTRLIQHGDVTLQADVSLDPDTVECYFNGTLVETKTDGPFTFTIDTSSIQFGKASVTFIAKRGSDTSTDSIDLLIDNTVGAYPLVEDFETGGLYFKGIDAKNYNLSVLTSLKTIDGPGANWTQNDVQNAGAGSWVLSTSGGYNSANCSRFGNPANLYDAFEVDALVSRQLDLTGATTPTLTFYHHYNIEDGGSANDRAFVAVTENYGQSFTVAKLKSGSDTRFTGFLSAYALAEVNLAPFAGKKVHVVLAFESNAQTVGAQAGAAGWWVDHLTVAGDYSTSVPVMSGVSLPNWSVYGTVPKRPKLTISPQGASGIVKVRYLLDLVPLDTTSPPDVLVDVTTAPFTGSINLPNVANQLAQVKVSCWGAGNVAGPSFTVPLYMFNLGGDANADNMVDQLDTEFMQTKLGLTNADSGYWPFCDSNNDKIIDERDGSIVGYNWGQSL